MARLINIAVVGCGYWGPNLIRNFGANPEVHLAAICDQDPNRLKVYGSRYPDTRLETQFDNVLANAEIDGVVIATASPSHFPLASAALEAGKHVYVEKPMTLTACDAQALVNLAEQRMLILMVGHLLEYHPAVDYMKAYIDAGELGDVRYIYTHRLNLGKVRKDENALWSLAPHDISVINYLLGEEPLQVAVSGQSYLQDGVQDLVFAYLTYPGGKVAHVHVSWLDPHKIRKLTVVGSQKMIVFDDMEAAEKIRIYDKGIDLPEARFVSASDSLQLRNGDILIPSVDTTEPLQIECAEFVYSIRTGIPPRSDGRDGLCVVQVLEAGQRSLEQGGCPIDIEPVQP